MHRSLFLLVSGLTFASSVSALDSWPQWRGPNRDAISAEKGLLDRWDNAPTLIWQAKGIGNGDAGVVVDNGMACTIGQRGGKLIIVAFDDKTGKEIWRTEIDIGDKDNQGGQAHCTPTIDGERIYALSSIGILACFKTATGELIWKRSFAQEFAGLYQDQGYSESPLVDGDKVICTPAGPDAGIIALDKKTGKELWRSAATGKRRLSAASHASMIISQAAGIKQYVQLMRLGLVGIDAETGKQLWLYQPRQPGYRYATPISRGDYIFSPCGGVLLKLVATRDGGVEPHEVYVLEAETFWPRTGNAVLVGDYLYGCQSNGIPHCIEFLTGKPVWEKNRRLPSGYGGAGVIYADGHLYFKFEKGIMALVAATPEKFELKGQFTTGIHGYSHPSISNGRLYLRGSDSILCYDLKKK